MEVTTLDVAELADTIAIVAAAAKMAPLGGVFHLAMILRDKWLANQVHLLYPLVGQVSLLDPKIHLFSASVFVLLFPLHARNPVRWFFFVAKGSFVTQSLEATGC